MAVYRRYNCIDRQALLHVPSVYTKVAYIETLQQPFLCVVILIHIKRTIEKTTLRDDNDIIM